MSYVQPGLLQSEAQRENRVEVCIFGDSLEEDLPTDPCYTECG